MIIQIEGTETYINTKNIVVIDWKSKLIKNCINKIVGCDEFFFINGASVLVGYVKLNDENIETFNKDCKDTHDKCRKLYNTIIEAMKNEQ